MSRGTTDPLSLTKFQQRLLAGTSTVPLRRRTPPPPCPCTALRHPAQPTVRRTATGCNVDGTIGAPAPRPAIPTPLQPLHPRRLLLPHVTSLRSPTGTDHR